MQNAPCYKCPDRKLLCHDDCSRHKKYRKSIEKINGTIKKEKDLYNGSK